MITEQVADAENRLILLYFSEIKSAEELKNKICYIKNTGIWDGKMIYHLNFIWSKQNLKSVRKNYFPYKIVSMFYLSFET